MPLVPTKLLDKANTRRTPREEGRAPREEADGGTNENRPDQERQARRPHLARLTGEVERTGSGEQESPFKPDLRSTPRGDAKSAGLNAGLYTTVVGPTSTCCRTGT